MRKISVAAALLLFTLILAGTAHARRAPQYVPTGIEIFKDGKRADSFYAIDAGKTERFDVMAIPDQVTGQFTLLDETVIDGDSFSIDFTPIVDGTTRLVSCSMTQPEIISNSMIDPALRAQKIATLTVSGISYPDLQDSDYADIHIYGVYSFERPDGESSGNIVIRSNAIRIRRSSGSGSSGGGGCGAFGDGALLFPLVGFFMIVKKKFK